MKTMHWSIFYEINTSSAQEDEKIAEALNNFRFQIERFYWLRGICFGVKLPNLQNNKKTKGNEKLFRHHVYAFYKLLTSSYYIIRDGGTTKKTVSTGCFSSFLSENVSSKYHDVDFLESWFIMSYELAMFHLEGK